MIELHPEILSKNGKKLFAILPYTEFLKVQEELEDADDLRELRKAREESKHDTPIPFEEVAKKYRKKK